jgi:hypothetical protein
MNCRYEEDLRLQVVHHALPEPAEAVAAQAVEKGTAEVDSQQAEDDPGQQRHRFGGRAPVLERGAAFHEAGVLVDDRGEDVVYQLLVQQRRQQTDAGDGDGQQEPGGSDQLVRADVGEQPPEGLRLADAVRTYRRARTQGAAAGSAVLDSAHGRGVAGGFLSGRMHEGGFDDLGNRRELVESSLGETHDLAAPAGQVDDQGAVADVAPGADLLDIAERYFLQLFHAAAVRAQHHKALVRHRQPGLVEASLLRDVRRQQHHQQLAGPQLPAQVSLEFGRNRLYQVHIAGESVSARHLGLAGGGRQREGAEL